MAFLSDYDYELPESSIAQTPLQDRDGSKLLWLDRRSGEIRHFAFRQVVDLFEPGDLLVANNTRVTALRLLGQKPTGAKVELLLIKPLDDCRYTVLAKPGNRLKRGARAIFLEGLECEIEEELPDGQRNVRFFGPRPVPEMLGECGSVPLPPYIHHALENSERYQTVYGREPGSSAAPTAGLHFTERILAALSRKGIDIAYVTLDVGIDTFRPIKSEDLDRHQMHGERCAITPETAERINTAEGRIVAVGTTAVRTLESFAIGPREVEQGSKVTDIFIRPGFRFQIIDGLFTNFHMPRTTMLVMLDALAGKDAIFNAYREALAKGYRFLSFGDSMLIL